VSYSRPAFNDDDATWNGAGAYTRPAFDDADAQFGAVDPLAYLAVDSPLGVAQLLAASNVSAWASADSPLGEPAFVGFNAMVSSWAAADSPLGDAALLADHGVASWLMAADGPLGTPAILAEAEVIVAGWLAADGPLGPAVLEGDQVPGTFPAGGLFLDKFDTGLVSPRTYSSSAGAESYATLLAASVLDGFLIGQLLSSGLKRIVLEPNTSGFWRISPRYWQVTMTLRALASTEQLVNLDMSGVSGTATVNMFSRRTATSRRDFLRHSISSGGYDEELDQTSAGALLPDGTLVTIRLDFAWDVLRIWENDILLAALPVEASKQYIEPFSGPTVLLLGYDLRDMAATELPRVDALTSAQADGPLGAPVLRVFHDFGLAPGLDLATQYYACDLLLEDGTVLARVPISSWQATLQLEQANYVQAVVPAVGPYASLIQSATTFVIYRGARLDDGATVEQEMARTVIGQRSFNQGPQRFTCTMSGYSAGFASEEKPDDVMRELVGLRSHWFGSGGRRVRCKVDWFLRPGMAAKFFSPGAMDIVFDVSFINYYVTMSGATGDAYMDVGERL
jgi:hypothetical protein